MEFSEKPGATPEAMMSCELKDEKGNRRFHQGVRVKRTAKKKAAASEHREHEGRHHEVQALSRSSLS